MIPFDLYIWAGARDKPTVLSFLATYAKDMKETATNYPFPQFSDEHNHVYYDLSSLIDVLLNNYNASYSLYFRSCRANDPIQSAMLFFTSDGGLIVGITMWCEPDNLKFHLQQLASCVTGECGYATIESPPPLTKNLFLNEVRQSPYGVFFPLFPMSESI
jgi:hypothetical protein